MIPTSGDGGVSFIHLPFGGVRFGSAKRSALARARSITRTLARSHAYSRAHTQPCLYLSAAPFRTRRYKRFQVAKWEGIIKRRKCSALEFAKPTLDFVDAAVARGEGGWWIRGGWVLVGGGLLCAFVRVHIFKIISMGVEAR